MGKGNFKYDQFVAICGHCGKQWGPALNRPPSTCDKCGGHWRRPTREEFKGITWTRLPTRSELHKEQRTMKKGDAAREAAELVEGGRDEAYGDALTEFSRISAVFEELTGHCITPEDMALLFICMKLVRDSSRAKEDHMVDVCGYASIRACIREQKSDEDEKE